jgi:hypothetical protein
MKTCDERNRRVVPGRWVLLLGPSPAEAAMGLTNRRGGSLTCSRLPPEARIGLRRTVTKGGSMACFPFVKTPLALASTREDAAISWTGLEPHHEVFPRWDRPVAEGRNRIRASTPIRHFGQHNSGANRCSRTALSRSGPAIGGASGTWSSCRHKARLPCLGRLASSP